jgi:hypothetical protein
LDERVPRPADRASSGRGAGDWLRIGEELHREYNAQARPPAQMTGTLDTAFQRWLTNVNGCQPDPAAADHGRPAVPVVLVAAPGGGARAAYWTVAALDDLTNPAIQRQALQQIDPRARPQPAATVPSSPSAHWPDRVARNVVARERRPLPVR